MRTGACARVLEGACGSRGRERSVSDRCTELREVHGKIRAAEQAL